MNQEQEYFKVKAISQSSIKAFLESPRHFGEFFNHNSQPTPSMILGTAIHTSVLEPHEFENRYTCPEQGKKSTAAFKAMTAGKIALSHTDFNKCLEVRNEVFKACGSNPVLGKMFELPHFAEKEYFWQDGLTGLECKAKMDMVSPEHGYILDLKTCQSASPSRFGYEIKRYGYHIQAAFYLDGLAANSLPTETEYYILALESGSPHHSCLFKLTKSLIREGRDIYQNALKNIKNLEGNFTAGYEYYSPAQQGFFRV